MRSSRRPCSSRSNRCVRRRCGAKGQIQQQQSRSEPEVRAHLEAHLTGAEPERLSELLERNRTQPLTVEEQAEMQALFDPIEAVATEKAAAIWLLSGRSPTSEAAR